MDIVERVARNIEKAAWQHRGHKDSLVYQTKRTQSLRKARAVLKALMKPTVEMGLAGFEQLNSEASPHAAEACWQAMLMEALKEPARTR